MIYPRSPSLAPIFGVNEMNWSQRFRDRAGAFAATSTTVMTKPTRDVLGLDRKSGDSNGDNQQRQQQRTERSAYDRGRATGDPVASEHNRPNACQQKRIARVQDPRFRRRRQGARRSIPRARR